MKDLLKYGTKKGENKRWTIYYFAVQEEDAN